MVNLALVALGVAVTFLVNIPFGYWRAYASRYKKRAEWIAAVHLPVPLIVYLRYAAGIGFSLSGAAYIAVFVLAYFTGQRAGGALYRKVLEKLNIDTRCFWTGLKKLVSGSYTT